MAIRGRLGGACMRLSKNAGGQESEKETRLSVRVRTLTLVLSQKKRSEEKNRLLYYMGWWGGVLFGKGGKSGGEKSSEISLQQE